MITPDQYFGPHEQSPDATEEVRAAAQSLLTRVNALLDRAVTEDVAIETNPGTGSQVGGSGNGGFRPQDCPIGAPHSSHKLGRAVDVYDPHNALDDWLTDEILEEFGLYREAPQSTIHWCHLTDRAPGSGHRTFNP